MDTLYTFWDNSTHDKTESVNFLGLMNSATKGILNHAISMSQTPGDFPSFLALIPRNGSFRKLGVPYLGVLIIRILLFRVLYESPLFSETPKLTKLFHPRTFVQSRCLVLLTKWLHVTSRTFVHLGSGSDISCCDFW